jgi:hypothetical protein
MKTVVQLQGCGYGDDGPLLSSRFKGERLGDLRIEAGNALVWKPLVMSADERIRFAWGGPILVNDRGCEPLSRRDQGMVSVH